MGWEGHFMPREQHIGGHGRLGKTECSGLGSRRSNKDEAEVTSVTNKHFALTMSPTELLVTP